MLNECRQSQFEWKVHVTALLVSFYLANKRTDFRYARPNVSVGLSFRCRITQTILLFIPLCFLALMRFQCGKFNLTNTLKTHKTENSPKKERSISVVWFAVAV